MASRCLNRRCARELHDDWAFCNWCGADNRPPAARVGVDEDEDEHLAPDGEYCVRCGVSILDLNESPDEEDHRLRVVGGWAALVLGAVALAASYALRPAGGVKTGAEPTSAATLAYLGARYGSYLLAAGVILLLVTPAIRRRR